MSDAKDTPSGLEVKILLPRIENETFNKDEILLKNVTFSNSWGENFSAYNNSAQANSAFSISSSEVTIYGVDFSAR
jgi:hypothetical protein